MGTLGYTGPKDELVQKYKMVRVGLQLLSAEQKANIIGYRERDAQFEGLVESIYVDQMPEGVECSPANLDDVIVCRTRGESNV